MCANVKEFSKRLISEFSKEFYSLCTSLVFFETLRKLLYKLVSQVDLCAVLFIYNMHSSVLDTDRSCSAT